MGQLTTHVLDTARGVPAEGVVVRLYTIDANGAASLLREATTNADGRCNAPLVEGRAFIAGRYRLTFAAGRYFSRMGHPLPQPPFIDDVSIDFGVADPDARYHVPLLMSPWSYSTYRGS